MEEKPHILTLKEEISAQLGEISEQLGEISEQIVKPAVSNSETIADAQIEPSQVPEDSVGKAAEMTAKATKQAAWINGISAVIVAIVVAGSATGGAYLYFEPMKEDLKKAKEQLHNLKSCFYYTEKQRTFEAAMAKKAEELFVLKSKDQKAKNAYFAYKASQEMQLLTGLNSIPNKLAYDKLKTLSEDHHLTLVSP